MVLGTDSSNWNLIWYVSKTFSKHIASSMEIFVNFKSVDVANIEKGCYSRNKGIGEALVTCKDSEFVVPSVLYVPNLGMNILNLSQLIAQGFEVEFLENHCVISRMFEKSKVG